MENFKDVQPCFDPYFAVHKILEIKDDFQVIAQFQCLLEHPVFEYLPAARIYSKEHPVLEYLPAARIYSKEHPVFEYLPAARIYSVEHPVFEYLPAARIYS